MTKLLALDCSTAACSVAVYYNGEMTQQFQLNPRAHNRLILPMIQAVLADTELRLNQLDAIAFACGPASFTGVRLCASVTQALAFAVDKPIIPISTLRALAQGAFRKMQAKHVLVAIDARMNEIYFGDYQTNEESLMQAMQPEQLLKPHQVLSPASQDYVLIGDGWEVYKQHFNFLPGILQSTLLYPEAYDVATLAVKEFSLGNCFPAEQALPTYLRKEEYDV